MYPTTPLMALSVVHTTVCRSGDEVGLDWRDLWKALYSISAEVSKLVIPLHPPPVQMTLSSGNVLLFPDRTDVPTVE